MTGAPPSRQGLSRHATRNSSKHNLVLSEVGMCLWKMVPELSRSFGTETAGNSIQNLCRDVARRVTWAMPQRWVL